MLRIGVRPSESLCVMEIGGRLFSFYSVKNDVIQRKLWEEKKGCTICMFLSKELFNLLG